jgi:hypothetical protein
MVAEVHCRLASVA